MEKYLNKIWYYFKKLWYQYVTCEAYLIVFSNKNYEGEILKTVYGDKIEILWEEENYTERYIKYYKYWVRNVQ